LAKEALYNTNRNIIFKETFNSENDVRRNRGVPVNVDFSDGVGSFNGTSSYIRYLFNNIKFNNFSIRIKIKSKEAVNKPYISTRDVSTTQGLVFRLEDTYKFRSYIDFGALVPNALTNNIYELNKWYEVVTTVDRNDVIKIYVDSIKGEDSVDISSLSTVDININSLLTIGKAQDSADFSNCEIDLVEIYNKALSAEEVSNLYNNTTYKDIRNNLLFDFDCRQGIIEDKYGTELINSNVVIKKDTVNTAYFNGVSSEIEAPLIQTGVTTVTGWVYNKKTAITYMVDFRKNSGNRYVYISSGVMGALSGSKYYVDAIYNNNTVPFNKWTFFALVSPNTTIINTLNIGNRTLPTYQWHDGFINQLRIYDGELTANEIMQLRTSQKRKYE